MNLLNLIGEYLVTLLLWCQVAFVAVSSTVIAYVYFRDRHERILHIAAIAIAHLIFTVMAVTALEWNLYPLVSLRGFMAFVGFTLSDYALIKISGKAYSLLRGEK
jgi:hypothetical protein